MDDLQMKVANKIPDVLIADKSGTTWRFLCLYIGVNLTKRLKDLRDRDL
jgi:hypothetical protein